MNGNDAKGTLKEAAVAYFRNRRGTRSDELRGVGLIANTPASCSEGLLFEHQEETGYPD